MRSGGYCYDYECRNDMDQRCLLHRVQVQDVSLISVWIGAEAQLGRLIS